MALEGLAEVAEAVGDLDEAERLCSDAVAVGRETGQRVRLASSLTRLGRLLLGRGSGAEATPLLAEARAISRELELFQLEAMVLALQARLPGADAEEALEAYEARKEQLSACDCLSVRLQLWRATSEPALLVEAKRLLDYLVEHAPEEYQVSMLENVPLHRDIVKAWSEHGESA